MKFYAIFKANGSKSQSWVVPAGIIGPVRFEAWGAAGGMTSTRYNAYMDKAGTKGKPGPANVNFTNHPTNKNALGVSAGSTGGYAAGDLAVTPTAGTVYTINVGLNGEPGRSTITTTKDKNGNFAYHTSRSGGDGGWGGGGDGGGGGHGDQYLTNGAALDTSVMKFSTGMPTSGSLNDVWYQLNYSSTESGSNRLHLGIVRTCILAYLTGKGTIAKNWKQTTVYLDDFIGSSGGGGGGSTDISTGSGTRLIVAGGGGGAGGLAAPSGGGTSDAPWVFGQTPTGPTPPYGQDLSGPASNAHGVNGTWATQTPYIVSGRGAGGSGGGTDTANNAPTLVAAADLGVATAGANGGNGNDLHAIGVTPPEMAGSGGEGGQGTRGGLGGAAGGSSGSTSGAASGTPGIKFQGGNGATCFTGYLADAWSNGGGGGGGGYFGGGGGSWGYDTDQVDVLTDGHTALNRAGGGGGGSNYVGNVFTVATRILAGMATPPASSTAANLGANGLGGFARITYRLAPKVIWVGAPSTLKFGTSTPVTFRYTPAGVGGAGIAGYQFGFSDTTTDVVPTSATFVSLAGATGTDFQITASANGTIGNGRKWFVKVLDTDNDYSPWVAFIITAVDGPTSAITAPAVGGQIHGPTAVTWTVGNQTPLEAYQLRLTGTGINGAPNFSGASGWKLGGSRVNLINDPGVVTAADWSSAHNVAPTSVTTPAGVIGVSGHAGQIAWSKETDGLAEIHTAAFTGLIAGANNTVPYLLTMNLASALANDPRKVTVEVWDDQGKLGSTTVSFAVAAAATKVAAQVKFTPLGQGIYAKIIPSAMGLDSGAPPLAYDFDDLLQQDGSMESGVALWAALGATITSDATHVHAGTLAGLLTAVTGASASAQPNLSTAPDFVTAGVSYDASGWVYSVAGRTVFWAINWYDQTGTFISSSSNSAVVPAATYTQISVTGVAPVNAYYGEAGPVYLTPTAGEKLWFDDVKFGKTNPFAAQGGGAMTIDSAQAYHGVFSLKSNGASGSVRGDLGPKLLAAGGKAGSYVLDTWAFVQAGSTHFPAMVLTVGALPAVTATGATKGAWVNLRIPFIWDGVQAIQLDMVGDATWPTWYDEISITPASTLRVGSTDASQITYFSDVYLEIAYTNPPTGGLTYFDGSHANGNPGSASWQGTTNASHSLLTGTDVTSDTWDYESAPQTNGQLYLDTISATQRVGSTAARAVNLNPSIPATPTVAMVINNTLGLMVLTINAADGASGTKTTYFDVFRNGIRIATHVLPDTSTRLATVYDDPASGSSCAYSVRAFDEAGGYADQTNGTITTA